MTPHFPSPLALDREFVLRYSRQLILPGWSSDAQQGLQQAAVAVSSRFDAAALYLAALGIGTLCLVGENEQLEAQLLALRPDLKINYQSESVPLAASLLESPETEPQNSGIPFRVAVDAAQARLLVNETPWSSPEVESALSPLATLPLVGALLILEHLSREHGTNLPRAAADT